MKTKLHYLFLLFCLKNAIIFAQFSAPELISANTNKIHTLVTADINNDGLKDIIATKKADTNVLVYYLNQGNLTFGTEVAIEAGSAIYTSVQVADFNNDGFNDIITIGDENNDVTLYMNNNLTFTPQVLLNYSFFDSDINVIDVDNDNDLDVAAVALNVFTLFTNDGNGNFTSQTITSPTQDYFDMAVGDINNDGFDDVITCGLDLLCHLNTNGVLDYDVARSDAMLFGGFTFCKLADIDGDNDVDLITDGADSSTSLIWHENDGNGFFTTQHIINTNVNAARSGTIADFDNDGDNDIILCNAGDLSLYTNNGSGVFTHSVLQDTNTTTIATVFGDDLNNDGLQDIIWSADLSYQLNTTQLALDKVEEEAVAIYPNPTKGDVFIEVKNEARLSAFNTLGQQVVQEMQLHQGGNKVSLKLPSGTYVFVIQTLATTFTKKVIIN